jgi:predicted HTH transcriptional regulator
MKNEINYLHKHIEELSTSSASEIGQLHIKSDMFVIQQHKQTKVVEEKMSFKQVRPSSIIKKDTSKMSFKSVGANSLRPSKEKNVSQAKDSKDDRETRVIDVIRDKGVVSIKDISTVIFDVSEKTIQRTLQTLIDKGQIKKEGERRWAKYQLI